LSETMYTTGMRREEWTRKGEKKHRGNAERQVNQEKRIKRNLKEENESSEGGCEEGKE
jgi:hypothetical protein